MVFVIDHAVNEMCCESDTVDDVECVASFSVSDTNFQHSAGSYV